MVLPNPVAKELSGFLGDLRAGELVVLPELLGLGFRV